MRRTLEALFRRRRQFATLLLLLPLLGLIIGLFFPRSYQSTATLWATRRYEVSDATWAARWYDMLGLTNSAPAEAQANSLMELLHSRAFALDVASKTDLQSQLPGSVLSDPTKRDDALFDEISRNVKVKASGNNLVVITYSNRDPQIAQQVLVATVRSFTTASQQLTHDAAQKLLDAFQAQVSGLQANADTATAALGRYVAQHPALREASAANNDPQYQLLSAQVQQARKSLADMQEQIALLKLQISTIGAQPDALFAVQDQPSLPTQPQSRMVTLLLCVATGLAIALLLSCVYLMLLTRADRAIHAAADLEGVLGVPVLMQLPHVELGAATPSPVLKLGRRPSGGPSVARASASGRLAAPTAVR